MSNNEYKKFSTNQFHYDSNGNMIDNQTGQRYIQSATNGQDVVVFGLPKMQIMNDATNGQDIVINDFYLKDSGRDINGNYTAGFHQHYGKDTPSPLTALDIAVHSMDDHNPNLITGIAPTVGLANPNILNNPIGKVAFNNPFTKRQIQQMLKGPKDMRVSYKYLTPKDISKDTKYLASSEAEVTHPYTVRFLNENPQVADNLGKVSDRLRYLDTGQGFQPSAMTNAQAMTRLPQDDKAITVTAGYSGMGPANTVHKGTASMGNYDFYTQNFLGAMNYSAFQPEELAKIMKDLTPLQKEYLNEQLNIIRRIHKKYGVKEFNNKQTVQALYKTADNKYPNHAGHKPYFKSDASGMATGKEYDPQDLIDLANANKAIGEFLGGGNTQIGGLGQVFHFGEPLRIGGNNKGFKDPKGSYTVSTRDQDLKESIVKNKKWNNTTFNGTLNNMEESISGITKKNRPLVITNVYDPIRMDTQAVPANTLIRTRKHGGTIKYNRL